ncbi:MAG: regulatory protein RecX [Marinilabilia sp.]
MDYKTALNKASAICSKQEYCLYDIRRKLKKWEISDADQDKILKHLVDEQFIDESRYASFYVRDKFRFNHWGRKKIWWQLRQKGLPEEIINEALEQIDEENYLEVLEAIIRDKQKQIRDREPVKQKAALIRHAVSKGYEYQDVIKVVEQLLH